MSDDFDTPFDPQSPTPLDQKLISQLSNLDPREPMTIRGFRTFTLVLHQGFTQVAYAAEVRPQDGAMFWITEEHAQRIGAALTGPMESFTLCLTCFEDEGALILADTVDPEVRIAEVTFSHKSGDEVTHEEARGFARLITRVQAHTAHLWAGEYDPGSLDVLLQELSRLGNTTLCELDVCDISRPEPEDRIHDPGLEALTRANQARHPIH